LSLETRSSIWQPKKMAKLILIVEDDSFLQGLASRKFKADGMDVLTASSHTEAFKILETQTPSIILLDLLLPEVDGFEILKTIRENPKTKSVPIIVFSNLSEDKDIKKAQELGVTEFMVKSNFTLDELAQKVKTVVGS